MESKKRAMSQNSVDKKSVANANWSPGNSDELYGVARWGRGAFRVSGDGHLAVDPTGTGKPLIDLFELVQDVRERGLHAPVLFRFHDLLARRLREIRTSFDAAVEQHKYGGSYRCLYPIKVNQERYLCEEIRDLARELDFGLEAGSKPELLAVLGLAADCPGLPIVCNGFKDDDFIETVILACKLGYDIVPIVEKPGELDLVLKHALQHKVRPRIGVRVKLHSQGSGMWDKSGGARSKFGLFPFEILEATSKLEAAGMSDCLQLLHCHIGSQVSRAESLRHPLEELARVYAELLKMGAGIRIIDVGGGLGVDYDGSRSGRGSSIDYGVAEYAELVIETLRNVCDDAGVPHPDVYSESGRAMVASSSVLVVEVQGCTQFEAPVERAELERAANGGSVPDVVTQLWRAAESIEKSNSAEMYFQAKEARDRAMVMFRAGELRLPMRALVDRLFEQVTRALVRASKDPACLPEELRHLTNAASDVYFANFSVFQSLPDSWALDQVFPICPLHRLDERPDRQAVIADISCDSDGEIDHFVGGGGEASTLELHGLRAGEAYYLGVFLVGAYQEVLGDLHNLLGDTHAVHVRLDEDDEWVLEEVVRGDTVREVLGYVHYDVDQLLDRMRREVERAIRRKAVSVAEGKQILASLALGLDGYTYLEERPQPEPGS